MDRSKEAEPAPAASGSGELRHRGLLVLLALVMLFALGRVAGGQIGWLIEQVRALGPWGQVLFLVAYVVSALVLFPSAVLTLGAGAVFGLARGVPLALLGATIGAAASFLVSRHLARDLVGRWIARDPRFAAIDQAVAGQGFRIVLLLRLSPLLPYVLVNYAMGITRVRMRDFMLASVGMVPAAFAYVYYGSVAGELVAGSKTGAATASGFTTSEMLRFGLLGLGVVATVAMTAIITRLASRAMRQATER